MRTDTVRSTTRGYAGFAGWTLAGALICLVALVFPTLGLVLLGVAIVVFARAPSTRRGTFGVFVGAALPLLWIAWDNRSGPGFVCTSSATSTRCDQLFDPWPWLIAGLVLITAGSVTHLLRTLRG